MSGARVLVVDDERHIRRSLEVSLECRGYAVETAETGEHDGCRAVSHSVRRMSACLVRLTHQVNKYVFESGLFVSPLIGICPEGCNRLLKR